MRCFECSQQGVNTPVVGVCAHCGIGLCIDHVLLADLVKRAGATRSRRTIDDVSCLRCRSCLDRELDNPRVAPKFRNKSRRNP